VVAVVVVVVEDDPEDAVAVVTTVAWAWLPLVTVILIRELALRLL
jgi:hypothetical protein